MRSRFLGIVYFIFFLFFGGFVSNLSAAETASSVGTSIVYGDRDNASIRDGNFNYQDIPLLVVNVIEFMLAFAGAISVAALIYHAVKMQFASGISGDSSGVDHAKHGIKGALIGFVLSMSAWFIMTKFVELLVENTK